MIRIHVVALIAALTATTSAWAHPGHVDEVAGHSHWLAYGAAALAVVIAVWAVLTMMRRRRLRDR